ncbi:unnamed protein product [Litomosoides sigmodontis]|uniref:Uncharacterized protein n=1 Tax=Litomosoides sigmodontis TaxID=42156 RepID=A0A3P6UL48_LITSI|nr:unnamed protein product [Litomosoides sigmodontis]
MESTKGPAKSAANPEETSIMSSEVKKEWRAFENDPCKQVFSNRSVYLQKIRYYGFDMDFTLAIYKSPDYEILLYNSIINRLILLGYPEQLRSFPYEQDFAIRGLWFDRTFGNLLKVDGFGNILVGLHGYNYLRRSDIKKQYPNKFISLRHPENILVMNSLFDIAHTYVLITLIHYFDNHKDYERTSDGTGVRNGDTIISYKSLAEDVLSAVNYVHNDSSLKSDVLRNLDKYIIKDNRIKSLLKLISAHGGRTFLLTNSNYSYTNGILSYLIGSDWTSYFDVSIVDAKKPLWFVKGTVFRQIDTETGTPKIGVHQGLLQKGDVYAGGNSDDFRRLFNARDREVLYIGDHIFGDVLKSKKTKVTNYKMCQFCKLSYRKELRRWINATAKWVRCFEAGHVPHFSRHSSRNWLDKCLLQAFLGFLRLQVERFADLYSSSCYNLLYYPHFYFFRAPMTLMPHEVNTDRCIRERKSSSSSGRGNELVLRNSFEKKVEEKVSIERIAPKQYHTFKKTHQQLMRKTLQVKQAMMDRRFQNPNSIFRKSSILHFLTSDAASHSSTLYTNRFYLICTNFQTSI